MWWLSTPDLRDCFEVDAEHTAAPVAQRERWLADLEHAVREFHVEYGVHGDVSASIRIAHGEVVLLLPGGDAPEGYTGIDDMRAVAAFAEQMQVAPSLRLSQAVGLPHQEQPARRPDLTEATTAAATVAAAAQASPAAAPQVATPEPIVTEAPPAVQSPAPAEPPRAAAPPAAQAPPAPVDEETAPRTLRQDLFGLPSVVQSPPQAARQPEPTPPQARQPVVSPQQQVPVQPVAEPAPAPQPPHQQPVAPAAPQAAPAEPPAFNPQPKVRTQEPRPNTQELVLVDRRVLTESNGRRKSRGRTWLVGTVAAAGLILAGGGGAVLTMQILNDRDEEPADVAQVEQTPQVHVESGLQTPVPGFSTTKAWTYPISETAAVTASSVGVVVIDQTRVTVLDPATGEQIHEFEADGDVTFAVQTTLGGENIVALGTATTLTLVWPDGQTKDIALPEGASVSSAGNGLLVQGSTTYIVDTSEEGLTQVDVPADMTPLAVEDGELVSVGWQGPIQFTTADGVERAKIPLTPPDETSTVAKWVTAGHGLAVVIWAPSMVTPEEDTPVKVVVHSVSHGSVLSENKTTWGRVAEAKWVRGQGFQRAAFGRWLFDMNTGKIAADGTQARVQFNTAADTVGLGSALEGNVLVEGTSAWATDTRLLAITNDVAVIRSDDTEVSALSRDAEAYDEGSADQ